MRLTAMQRVLIDHLNERVRERIAMAQPGAVQLGQGIDRGIRPHYLVEVQAHVVLDSARRSARVVVFAIGKNPFIQKNRGSAV